MNNAAPAPGRRPASTSHASRPEPASETVKVKFAMGGIRTQLAARVDAGSRLNSTVAAFVLIAASCLVMAVASLIGVSALTALIVGLGAPASVYLLIHATSRQSRQSGRGKHARR